MDIVVHRRPSKKLVRPFDEVFHVRRIGVATVVLTPSELAVENVCIHRRHVVWCITVHRSETLRSQKRPYWIGQNRSHEAAFMVEPFGVPFFRNPITDECEPRGG